MTHQPGVYVPLRALFLVQNKIQTMHVFKLIDMLTGNLVRILLIPA